MQKRFEIMIIQRVGIHSVPDNIPDICACIGFFDGLHKGHQELIRQTIKMSEEKHCESALITFDPDPWVTIRKMENVQHLALFEQRVALCEKFGIDRVLVLDFTEEMAALNPDDFCTQVLDRLPLKGLVCGFDFHFGRMGRGDADYLKTHASYPVMVVDSVNDIYRKISSSYITMMVEEGNVEYANQLLGYRYQFLGKVVPGRQVGRKMGFPTANIAFSPEYIVPARGVYGGYIKVKGMWHKAMANIGYNPTCNPTDQLSLETHIIDFNEDLYGEDVIFEFEKYLRDEKKFDTMEELIDRLSKDADIVRGMPDHE